MGILTALVLSILPPVFDMKRAPAGSASTLRPGSAAADTIVSTVAKAKRTRRELQALAPSTGFVQGGTPGSRKSRAALTQATIVSMSSLGPPAPHRLPPAVVPRLEGAGATHTANLITWTHSLFTAQFDLRNLSSAIQWTTSRPPSATDLATLRQSVDAAVTLLSNVPGTAP